MGLRSGAPARSITPVTPSASVKTNPLPFSRTCTARLSPWHLMTAWWDFVCLVRARFFVIVKALRYKPPSAPPLYPYTLSCDNIVPRCHCMLGPAWPCPAPPGPCPDLPRSCSHALSSKGYEKFGHPTVVSVWKEQSICAESLWTGFPPGLFYVYFEFSSFTKMVIKCLRIGFFQQPFESPLVRILASEYIFRV